MSQYWLYIPLYITSCPWLWFLEVHMSIHHLPRFHALSIKQAGITNQQMYEVLPNITLYTIAMYAHYCSKFILNNPSADMYSLIFEIKIEMLPLFITCPDLHILTKRIWHISSSVTPSNYIYHTLTALYNLPWPTTSHKPPCVTQHISLHHWLI
jgi:hypothetical protein